MATQDSQREPLNVDAEDSGGIFVERVFKYSERFSKPVRFCFLGSFFFLLLIIVILVEAGDEHNPRGSSNIQSNQLQQIKSDVMHLESVLAAYPNQEVNQFYVRAKSYVLMESIVAKADASTFNLKAQAMKDKSCHSEKSRETLKRYWKDRNDTFHPSSTPAKDSLKYSQDFLAFLNQLIKELDGTACYP